VTENSSSGVTPAATSRHLPRWVIVGVCMPLTIVVLGILGILAVSAVPHHGSNKNMPVLPDSLDGNRRNDDLNTMKHRRESVNEEGSETRMDTAFYGGQYLLTAYYNENVDAAQKFGQIGLVGAPTSFGRVLCGSSPATDRLPAGTFNLCLREGTRGYVTLLQTQGDGPLSDLAGLTNDVWSAQPFAD
jgi:hypothetical protein